MNLRFHISVIVPSNSLPTLTRLRPSFRAFGALTFADIQGESWICSLKKKHSFFWGQKKRMEHVFSTIFVSTSYRWVTVWDDLMVRLKDQNLRWMRRLMLHFTSMWQNLHIRHEKDNAVNIRYIVCMYIHLCHKHQPTVTAGKHCSR